MGQYSITIEGRGAHHQTGGGKGSTGADALARAFVERLIEAGHDVGQATFTRISGGPGGGEGVDGTSESLLPAPPVEEPAAAPDADATVDASADTVPALPADAPASEEETIAP